MEYVTCDFCGGGDYVRIAKQTDLIHRTTTEEFWVVKCIKCNLHYTNPRPTREKIGDYYPAKYAFHEEKPRIPSWISTCLKYTANSFTSYIFGLLKAGRLVINYVGPNIPDPVISSYKSGLKGKFLDIGCGTGVSAHFWGARGAIRAYQKITSVAGIEVSQRARNALDAYGIQSWRSICDVPKDEQFAVIRMNWSLEHTHSPDRYFSFIAAHLKPGGKAIIAVPNFSGLIYRIEPSCLEVPIHLYHFTPPDMERYGVKHQLKLSSLKTFSYPGMFNEAAKLGLIPKELMLASTVLEARRLQRILTKFDEAGLGNDMIAIYEHA
jgi:SAM-dependent methyltransferase